MGIRAATWQSTLFQNIPRAPDDGALALRIAAQWNPAIEVMSESRSDPHVEDSVPEITTPGLTEDEPALSDGLSPIEDGSTETSVHITDDSSPILSPPDFLPPPVTKPAPINLNTPFHKPSFVGAPQEEEVVISTGGSFTFS